MNIIINNTSDYFKLYSILEKEISNQEISIMLNKSILKPFDVLVITLFVIRQKQRGCDINIVAQPLVLSYLEAINIVEFCQKNSTRATTIEAIPSFTAMPIRRVETETMNDYIIRTQEYFKTFCPNKDLGMLDLCLSELINNVYNHSFSTIGAYVFCQYYHSENLIVLAVADLGIGIPMSINTYNKSLNQDVFTSSKDCVSWALKERNTTQSTPQNRGLGLDTVKSFMKSNNMTWQLYTDDLLLNAFPSRLNYQTNPISFFKGTIVQLKIDINKLPSKDINEDFDWF